MSDKKEIRERIRNMGFNITDVFTYLCGIRDEIQSYNDSDIDDGEGNIGVDVRINSHGRGYQIFSGDSQYDQDHRGYWGYSFINKDHSNKDLKEVAYDLCDQMLDDKYSKIEEENANRRSYSLGGS